MPRTDIIIYQDKNGKSPLLDWLDSVPQKVKDKCVDKIDLLSEKGYDLRMPHCKLLRDKIYALRARRGNLHYRILYCFQGENIVLLSHGCTKQAKIPEREINRAIRNHEAYNNEPQAHTYIGEF